MIVDWRYQSFSQIEVPRKQASETIIDRLLQILLASEIPFGGQN
jgi:hypothetical protein